MICFRFFFVCVRCSVVISTLGKKNWVSRIKKTIYLLSFHGICSIFILSWNEKEIKTKNYTKTHSSLKTIEHVNISTSASCATLTWKDAHNFTSEEIKFHYLSISNGEKMHGITEKGEHRTYVSYIFNCRRRSIVQSCCVFFCCCFFSFLKSDILFCDLASASILFEISCLYLGALYSHFDRCYVRFYCCFSYDIGK